jgi:hypothetical protein
MGVASVNIVLSDAQVAYIARELSERPPVTAFIAGLTDAEGFQDSVQAMLSDTRYSRTLLRALLVLAAFPDDGSDLALKDVTSQLHWSPSTTHRYFATWVALGALERDPTSRRYRLAPAPTGAGSRVANVASRVAGA